MVAGVNGHYLLCAAVGLSGLLPAPVLAELRSTSDGLPTRTIVVTTMEDSGPGSLRAALKDARDSTQPIKIEFGTSDGPFSTPQVIELSAPLPEITGTVAVDGFISGLLWKAYGVTISGAESYRIFDVATDGDLTLEGITLKDGHAESGGGILNRGRLVVEGVTLVGNRARDAGGAIANQGGTAFMINSTALNNSAVRGGAIANLAGSFRLTNVTLSENEAEEGTAVFSLGPLTLANSILVGEDEQCVNEGTLAESSSHNVFTSGSGCGDPIFTDDPLLQNMGYYNGPTPTIPITGTSPARNLGSNEAAVDADGERLKWDQRGNGDPRFARGYVDIGAFEHQSQLPTEHVVDTLVDNGLRGCTRVGKANCPLRAAVELGISGRHMVPIRFHPGIFSEPQRLRLPVIPAGADRHELLIDGSDTGGVTIVVPNDVPWKAVNGATIEVDAHAGNPDKHPD